MNTTAIILAGGSGTRMNNQIPKQYMDLSEKPVLNHVIDVFQKSKYINDIILVLPKDDIDYVRNNILNSISCDKLRSIASGGTTRSDSVINALYQIEDCDYCLIHDAARALISVDLIDKVCMDVRINEAIVTGVPVTDTIKRTNESGIVTETIDRNCLWQIQTPQAFKYSEIRKAYDLFCKAGRPTVTDDAMVMEMFGSLKVHMLMGSYDNIKLTVQRDIAIAETILTRRQR